jgi:predicted ATPase
VQRLGVSHRRLQRIETETIYQKQVFFIQHLGFITPTAVRRISLEEALRFERVHKETYRNHGFELVPIAPRSLLDRVEAIKRFTLSG